ncbi:MAG: hypothetical protein AAF988_01750 [Pseudomonadota bacterium]
MAQDLDANDPRGRNQMGQTGGGTCDWNQYKDSIKATESSGRYTAFNPRANNKGNTANGMYQFIEPTAYGLQTYKNAQSGNPAFPPGCLNLGQGSGVGFNRDECAGLQEAMMDEFSHNNLIWLQNNCPAAVEAVNSGRTVEGGYRGQRLTCPVTWSGVLAGAHLGGSGGVCSTLGGGPDRSDNLGTSRLGYVCQHGGLQVPSADCSPADYSTGNGGTFTPPPGTGWTGTTPPPGRDGDEALRLYWVGGLQLMANQLTAVMMQQVQAVGKFFDAKHQLETQLLMQQKYAEAHKDYHPSEQMCEIGTFSRDLLMAEQRSKLSKTAIGQKMMDRGLNSGDGLTTEGNLSDKKSRLEQYIDTFCSIEDNARNNSLLCENSGDADQQNIDIDYTRLIDLPLTLDIDLTTPGFTDPENPTGSEISEEKTETNLFAFLNYIFMHENFPTVGREKTTLKKFVIPYQDMRSIMAMRSVAYSSFAHIIGMKSSGSKRPTGEGARDERSTAYIKALMREMGIDPTQIDAYIGENPSYYAQMEVLTKVIYQNPDFIANLYDKPANVRRIRAAMEAIKLMQDRDIHEALMRREMLISMILELQLRHKQNRLSDEINNMIGVPRVQGQFVSASVPSTEPEFVPVSNTEESGPEENTMLPPLALPPLAPLSDTYEDEAGVENPYDTTPDPNNVYLYPRAQDLVDSLGPGFLEFLQRLSNEGSLSLPDVIVTPEDFEDDPTILGDIFRRAGIPFTEENRYLYEALENNLRNNKPSATITDMDEGGIAIVPSTSDLSETMLSGYEEEYAIYALLHELEHTRQEDRILPNAFLREQYADSSAFYNMLRAYQEGYIDDLSIIHRIRSSNAYEQVLGHLNRSALGIHGRTSIAQLPGEPPADGNMTEYRHTIDGALDELYARIGEDYIDNSRLNINNYNDLAEFGKDNLKLETEGNETTEILYNKAKELLEGGDLGDNTEGQRAIQNFVEGIEYYSPELANIPLNDRPTGQPRIIEQLESLYSPN